MRSRPLSRPVGPPVNPGLLGRLWRPSVARAAWSREVDGRIATTLLVRAAAY